MCCLLVSGFLTEITQQIHSLRASGVMSSHFARATGSEIRTFRKSAGIWCTALEEIAFLLIDFILYRPCCCREYGARLASVADPLLVQLFSWTLRRACFLRDTAGQEAESK